MTQFQFESTCEKLLEYYQISNFDNIKWNDLLQHTAGAHVVAGEHEDREILELLQNARDAIVAEDKDSAGKILIAVTDTGMLIANTGAPFKLNEEKVFEAVTLLGKSSKNEKELIGHKGIGLKSILQRFGKFTIHTHLYTENDKHELTACFSRALTWNKLKEGLEDSKFKDKIIKQLPRLPLFRIPSPGNGGGDALYLEIKNAIAGQFDLDQYVTSICLYYHDEDWDKLLVDTCKSLPEPDKTDFEKDRQTYSPVGTNGTQKDLWTILTDPKQLDPRTFILLGHIKQIDMVRLKTTINGLSIDDARTYKIEEIKPQTIGLANIEIKEIEITEIRGWLSERVEHPRKCYLRFSRQTIGENNEHLWIHLLFKIPENDQTFTDERLYLYYPIDKAKSWLPFIIHGPFKVTPSRKELSGKAEKDNEKVIKSALELLRDCLPTLLQDERTRDWMPWMVLPLKPTENDERLKDVIDLIRTSRCVPGQDRKDHYPNEVYFLPDRPEAFKLFDKLHSDLAFLAQANLATFSESLKVAAEESGFGEFNKPQFIENLNLDIENEYEEGDARAFFSAICSLAKEDQALSQRIGEKKLPIFPVPGVTQFKLVQAMSKPLSASGEEDENQNPRIVFLKSQITEEQIRPPALNGVEVYVIDYADFKETGYDPEVLKRFKRDWDINDYESNPDLFKRISERLDEYKPDVLIPALGYLAGLLAKINPTKSDGLLRPRPYANIDVQLLEKYLDPKENTSRQDLVRMQDWRHKVKAPVKDGGLTEIKNLVFGPEWADLLDKYLDDVDLQRWSQAIRALDAYRQEAPDDCKYLAGPDDPIWDTARSEIEKWSPGTGWQLTLFKLLLLFGVRIGPRIEWRWYNKKGQANDAMASRSYEEQKHDKDLQAGLSGYTIFIEQYYKYDRYELINVSGQGGRPPTTSSSTAIYAWTWFKDLENGDIKAPGQFSNCLKYIWNDLVQVLETGWYLVKDPDRWKLDKWNPQPRIPSMAAYQLYTLPIWQGDGGSHIPLFCFDDSNESALKNYFPQCKPEQDNGQAAWLDKFSGNYPNICKLRWLLEHKTELVSETPDQNGPNSKPLDEKVRSACSRLLAQINPEGSLNGLMFPVVKNGQWYAFRYDGKNGGLLSYFDHSPLPWEKDEITDKYLILADKTALDEKIRPLASKIGAKTVSSDRPIYEGQYDPNPESGNAIKAIVARINKNKHILLEVIKSIPTQDMTQDKQGTIKEREDLIKTIIKEEKIKAGIKTGSSQWACKDKDSNLIFFMDDYQKLKEVVIAYGLAQQLKLPGALSEIQMALMEDTSFITANLQSKGILLKTQNEIRLEKFTFILKFVGCDVPPNLMDETFKTAFRQKYPEFDIQPFLDLLNSTAEQAEFHLDDLRKIIHILQSAGWTTDQCLDRLSQLSEPYQFINELESEYTGLLRQIALARFINEFQGRGTDFESDESQDRARALNEDRRVWNISDQISDLLMDFLDIQQDSLLLAVETQIELREKLDSYLQKQAHTNWPELIQKCLESKSLDTLLEEYQKTDPDTAKRQRKDLNRKSYDGKLRFELEITPQNLELQLPDMDRTGQGQGLKGEIRPVHPVSLRQGFRGEIAEIFVLEVCWDRFTQLAEVDQKKLLEKIKDRSGALRKSQFPQIEIPNKEQFLSLLDFSDYGLAGFDVLVPACLWDQGPDSQDFYDAEIKSIFGKAKEITSVHMVLTTHEYRTAKSIPDHYRLFLVAVPYDDPNQDELHDIKFLGMVKINDQEIEAKIKLNDVRGGHFYIDSPIKRQTV